MRRAARTTIKVLNGIGVILMSSGATLLMIFVCAIDSEGEEVWRFLWRLFGLSALLILAGFVVYILTKQDREPLSMLYFH